MRDRGVVLEAPCQRLTNQNMGAGQGSKVRPPSNRQGLSTCNADDVDLEVDVRDRGVFLEAPCQSLTKHTEEP